MVIGGKIAAPTEEGAGLRVGTETDPERLGRPPTRELWPECVDVCGAKPLAPWAGAFNDEARLELRAEDDEAGGEAEEVKACGGGSDP